MDTKNCQTRFDQWLSSVFVDTHIRNTARARNAGGYFRVIYNIIIKDVTHGKNLMILKWHSLASGISNIHEIIRCER